MQIAQDGHLAKGSGWMEQAQQRVMLVADAGPLRSSEVAPEGVDQRVNVVTPCSADRNVHNNAAS